MRFKMHHDALYNEIAIDDASIQTEYWMMGGLGVPGSPDGQRPNNR